MASAVKHNIGLDPKACIDSAAKRSLSDMSWHGFTDFKQECVTSWTKLFATNEVQFTDNAENGGYPPTQNGDIRSLFWLFSLMALQN